MLAKIFFHDFPTGLKKVFNDVDGDGNEKITKDELCQLLKQVNQQYTPDEVDQLFKAADRDSKSTFRTSISQ